MAQAVGPVAVFVLALAVRVALVAHSDGGPFGDFGYDSGVYYNAADALIHGRMPYVDFTLLHPPGLMLALTPFAFVGTLTTDHLGFVVANGSFEVIGAVNALLVVLIARRAGVGRFAAFVGGVFYAAWPGAAGAEVADRLEPLGNLLLLGALFLLVGPQRGSGKRRMLLCGALLGAASVTKIWWIVPLLIIAVWTARKDRRQGVLLLVGAAAGATAIAGPFFLRSPTVMWRMVVSDQLGRPSSGRFIPVRLFKITSLHELLPQLSHRTTEVLLVPIGALVLVAFVRAWRRAELRPIVAMGVAQLLVLLAAPIYFGYYADYLAPASSLVLAAAVSTRAAGTGARVRFDHLVGSVCVVVVTAAAVADIVLNAPTMVAPFPGNQLAAAAAHAHLRCVMADSPMALVELNVLTRDLDDGCPDRVDVSGSTYDVDRPADPALPRVDNERWQHDLYRYLTSGDAEIVIRHHTGISPRTRRRLDRFPPVVRLDHRVLRRTR